MQIMSHRCCYCQKPFTRAGSKRHHEKYTCWKRIENGHDKLPLVDLPSSTAITRVDAPKIAFPTEKQNGIPNGIERGIAFRFKTPSSILVVGLSGCGKTCFTESLLLDHLEKIVCKPSSHVSLLLRGVATWIPRHERRWHTISRRGSYHLPFAKMVSKRWFTCVR